MNDPSASSGLNRLNAILDRALAMLAGVILLCTILALCGNL